MLEYSTVYNFRRHKLQATTSIYLKLLTQTERIPASAAARQATGTTSETCFHMSSHKHHLQASIIVLYKCKRQLRDHIYRSLSMAEIKILENPLVGYFYPLITKSNQTPRFQQLDGKYFLTTKSALMDFSHSTSVAKIEARGTTAVSEYQIDQLILNRLVNILLEKNRQVTYNYVYINMINKSSWQLTIPSLKMPGDPLLKHLLEQLHSLAEPAIPEITCLRASKHMQELLFSNKCWALGSTD